MSALPISFGSTKHQPSNKEYNVIAHTPTPQYTDHHNQQHTNTNQHNQPQQINQHYRGNKYNNNKRPYQNTHSNQHNQHHNNHHRNRQHNDNKVWFKDSMLQDPWAALMQHNQSHQHSNANYYSTSSRLPAPLIPAQFIDPHGTVINESAVAAADTSHNKLPP